MNNPLKFVNKTTKKAKKDSTQKILDCLGLSKRRNLFAEICKLNFGISNFFQFSFKFLKATSSSVRVSLFQGDEYEDLSSFLLENCKKPNDYI